VRGHVQAALENVALWHERDISHSSAERVILPDATILCDFMLARMTRILDGLVVHADRMRHNLELTHGLIYSQAVLLALTDSGMDRDAAYLVVQRHAMRTWAGEGSFRDLLAADPEVARRLPGSALDACFEPDRFLRHVRTIHDRVFGGETSEEQGV
jgi:adenylosuccinate lyase